MPHATVAVSESTFQRTINLITGNFTFEAADSTSFGAFTAGYDVKAHLEGGTVDLRSDNTIEIRELDLKWDRLEFSLGLDIPEICVGGGCINMPWPIPDLCLPEVCIFSGDPDVSIAPDFAAFVAQEVSIIGSMDVRYWNPAAPPPTIDVCGTLRDILSDLDILKPFPNRTQWHIFLNPQTIDVDLFDFPDIVGDLIEDALTDAIEALIPGGWVRDLLLAIIGGIADLIRFILDIPDEIDEWLSDLFNVSFGLLDFIGTLFLDLLGNCLPIYKIDDPFEVLPAKDGLVPVLIPIRNLSAMVNDVEMVVSADVGQ
jgi:hypothetical protein